MSYRQKFQAFRDSISEERLRTFSRCGSFSEIQAVKRFVYNNYLSSLSYEALSILEIVLRNHTCISWNRYFVHRYSGSLPENYRWPLSSEGLRLYGLEKAGWPRSTHNAQNAMKKHHYLLSQTEKERKKINDKFELKFSKEKNRGENADLREVYNGDVVAQLTFGFWRACYDQKYKDINRSQLFNTFKNFQLSSNQTRDQALSQIQNKIDRAHKLRNRISHHEPIFTSYYFDSLKFVIELVGFLNKDMLKFVSVQEVEDLKTKSMQKGLI